MTQIKTHRTASRHTESMSRGQVCGGPLTAGESEQLSLFESTVEQGLKSFVEVGQALAGIRDAKLYRATHGTFEAYLGERWGMGRQRGWLLIGAAEAAGNVNSCLHGTPANEAQARPLTKLKTPELQREAWSLALESAPEGRVTARHVEDAVRHVSPSPPPNDPSLGSKSGREYDSDEWYTPAEYIDAVREALGDIDLDPASSNEAQAVVRARRFFTKDTDGLSQEWDGRVFVNPPYSRDLSTKFADKLLEELRAGRVTAAVLLQNASTDTGWFHDLAQLAHSMCLTRGRISFIRKGAGAKQGNRWGQVFFYFGPDPETFEGAFWDLGLVGRMR